MSTQERKTKMREIQARLSRLRGTRYLIRQRTATAQAIGKVRQEIAGMAPADTFLVDTARLDRLASQVADDLVDLYAELTDVEHLIQDLPATERILLHLRYVRCLDWKSCMTELGYSETSIFRLHRQALSTLAEKAFG